MTYYVTQYGNYFFSIRRVQGYTGNMIFNGTKISNAEYKKLWNSSTERTIIKGITGKFDEVRIAGNASEILNKPLNTIRGN